MKRLLTLLILAALVVGVGALSGWSSRPLQAALLLADLRSGAESSLFKRITPRPDRQPLAITRDGRRLTGDLYLPGERAAAGLILVPGAAEAGKDDARVIALAQSLARSRFLVLVPDIANQRSQTMTASDRQPILDAAHFLLGERHMAGIGVAAISWGGVPAVLAALEEPRIDFLVGIGTPYDLTAVITYFTTGAYRDKSDQPWQHGDPNDYGKWVFVRTNAPRLSDSGDRALLTAIAERKQADLSAPIDDLTAKLGPQGRAVMALLNNKDPDQVPALIAALPPAIRDEIAAMNLATHDLADLHAQLFLIHGRNDRIVPWTESAALARAAPQADMILLDNLAHADLKPGRAMDSYTLWRATIDLLEERDSLADRRQ